MERKRTRGKCYTCGKKVSDDKVICDDCNRKTEEQAKKLLLESMNHIHSLVHIINAGIINLIGEIPDEEMKHDYNSAVEFCEMTWHLIFEKGE